MSVVCYANKPFSYYMLTNKKVSEDIKGFNKAQIDDYIENLSFDDAVAGMKLISARGNHEFTEKMSGLDWKPESFVEVSSDDHSDYKCLILGKRVRSDDERMDLHCMCADCDNVQSLGIDEQRHHFDTFEHLGDNKFKCALCGSLSVDVDVSIVNGRGDEVEI